MSKGTDIPMKKTSTNLKKLRDELRRHDRSIVKNAVMGGGNDTSFEQAFSNLAHAYLKDKAPTLLDYEVGFQLLDRNQENTKAVGIFGFKVGSQWLYAPVFFLSGDLKGHELLYIKNQDMFVPLKENWLNYLLNRRPTVLGNDVSKNMNELGVTHPDLYQLSRSPSKYASHMPTWVNDVLPTLAHAATTHPANDPKYQSLTDLPAFLKKEGKAVVMSLITGMKENAKLASVIDELHGLSIVDEAIAAIKQREQEANSNSVLKAASSGVACRNTPKGVKCMARSSKSVMPAKQNEPPVSTEINTEPGDMLKAAGVGDPIDDTVIYAGEKKIKIYVYDDVLQHGTDLEGLGGEERSKLMKDKVLIDDKRPDKEVSVAYEIDTPVKLENPGDSGLYDVLVKPNKFEKCLVITAPHCNHGPAGFATIVRLGDDSKGKAWLNIHPAHVWVGHKYSNQEYYDWWDSLPDTKELSENRNGLYMLVNYKGAGTLPFTVDKNISDDTRKIYDIYFRRHTEKGRPDHLPPIEDKLMYRAKAYDHFGNGNRIQLTGKKGARMRATGEDLYVPSEFKTLTLREGNDDDLGICGCSAHSEPSPIQPGSQLDVDMLLGTKTASVKIYDNGTELSINDKRMQKLAGLIHLVRDYGLREKQARIILKRAAEKKVARFRIKRADQSYELQQSGPSAPYFPEQPQGYDPMTGGQVPTNNTGQWNIKVPELGASMTDRSIYKPTGAEPDYQQGPDRQAQESALQAAQTGQKEIFDTAMIGSLLKAVRDDSMVDRYMGDLMKGLDRLGRILFLFYWHGEQFKERYGKTDMLELEDGIRNAFEYLGDLVLFLKQRAVDSGANSELDIGLETISG